MSSHTCKACGENTLNKNGTRADGSQKWHCKSCGSHANPDHHVSSKQKGSEIQSDQFDDAKSRTLHKTKYYLITCALEGSLLHKQLMHNIETYEHYLKKATGHEAQILVVPQRYTVRQTAEFEGWAPYIEPYLVAGRRHLHPKLELMADIKVLPTAINPVNGWEGISGKASSIIASPRMQDKVVPGLNGHRKRVVTTGTCTMPRYTESRAGAGAEFHHTFGFLMVELDGDVFHARQVHANSDGSFQDLNTSVRDGLVRRADYKAVVMGDVHEYCSSQSSLDGAKNLISAGKAETVVLHDVHDMHFDNHHNAKDLPFQRPSNPSANMEPVEYEVSQTMSFLREMERAAPEVLVVRSNHDDALDRWIQRVDWRYETESPEFYLNCALALSRNSRDCRERGLLSFWAAHSAVAAKFLALGEYRAIGGYVVSEHGHNGAGGTRGAPNQFRRFSEKMITGHTHTPGRLDGVTTVGTNSELELNYSKGKPSSWMHADAIITSNDKCQLIYKLGGKYTTFGWA